MYPLCVRKKYDEDPVTYVYFESYLGQEEVGLVRDEQTGLLLDPRTQLLMETMPEVLADTKALMDTMPAVTESLDLLDANTKSSFTKIFGC